MFLNLAIYNPLFYSAINMAFDTSIGYQIQMDSPDLDVNCPSGVDTFDSNCLSMNVSSQKRCSMCHANIKGNGLYSLKHDLIFCDLICAKIYSDNIAKIDIDFQDYRNKHVEGQLSATAEKIYQKYKYKFFQQLPILIINSEMRDILNGYLIENRIQDYTKQFGKIKAIF